MTLHIASDQDRVLFTEWRAHGRMEEISCKEIRDGQHYDNPLRITYSYYVDDGARPVGKVDCTNFNDRNRSCEIGYLINPSERGKGYGALMLRAVLARLFDEHDRKKVYCHKASFNEGVSAIVRKAWFPSRCSAS